MIDYAPPKPGSRGYAPRFGRLRRRRYHLKSGVRGKQKYFYYDDMRFVDNRVREILRGRVVVWVFDRQKGVTLFVGDRLKAWVIILEKIGWIKHGKIQDE